MSKGISNPTFRIKNLNNYVKIAFETTMISFFNHQGLCQVLKFHISENLCLSSGDVNTVVMWMLWGKNRKKKKKASEAELYHKLRASICGHIDDFVALNIPISSIPGCCQCGEGRISDTETPNTTKRHWKVIMTYQDKEQRQNMPLSKENWGKTMTWYLQVFPLSDWRRPSVAGYTGTTDTV